MTRDELLRELHKTPGYNLARECSAQIREDAATIEKYKRAMLELYAAISRIDYLCGQPNDHECSPFDVDKDEQRVVKRVATTIDELTRKVEELRQVISAHLAGSAIEELQGFRDELAKQPCSNPSYTTAYTSSSPYHGHALKGDAIECGNCPQDRARASKAKESTT